MSHNTIKAWPALSRALAAAGLAFALTGCDSLHGSVDDVFEPQLAYQRYPIEVAKGTVKLKLEARSAHLTPSQEDAVRRMALQALNQNADRVYVKRPAGQIAADAVAGRVTQIMTETGVTPARLSHSSYAGKGPVVVSYKRYFATTAACGNWPNDVTRSGQNNGYVENGCSQAHNIAALVANPKDLKTPRTLTASDPARRSQVFDDYRKPKNTATQIDQADRAVVSQVAQ